MVSVPRRTPTLSISRIRALAALALALVACGVPGLLAPTPTPTPTPTATPVPTPTPEPDDTGWQTLEQGIELRQVRVPTGDVAERLTLVRIKTADYRFRVRYSPGTARPVSGWAEEAEFPLLVINGGYFTPEHETTGLLISDGQTYGTLYGDYAGMFAVLPGERVEIRWLATEPYDPLEILQSALQSFPVLVKPGGVMGFPADGDDGRPARRTVVAQDRQGNTLFVVAPRGYLSLHEMARWLAEADLDLEVALNLDGGFSTGLYLAAGQRTVRIDSQVGVPSVITVTRAE